MRLLIVIIALISSPAFSEEEKAAPSIQISGVVKHLGSAMNAKVNLVKQEKDGKIIEDQKLCGNALSKRIGRISGMTVAAKGEWKGSKVKCFEATEFSVVKTSNGRVPLVGVLEKVSGGYVVKADDGSTKSISRVSKGLRGLVGKKVIIDVKPTNSPVGKIASYKVVSYAEFP